MQSNHDPVQPARERSPPRPRVPGALLVAIVLAGTLVPGLGALTAGPAAAAVDGLPGAQGVLEGSPALVDTARCLPALVSGTTGLAVPAGRSLPAQEPGDELVPAPVKLDRCEAWTTRYDEPTLGPDDAGGIAVNPVDGTVYITGLTEDQSFEADALTIALDPSTGAILWTARTDVGSNTDYGKHIAVTPDGTTLVIAGVTRAGGGGYNILLLALDAETGEVGWTQVHDGPAGTVDTAHAMTLSPDGASVYLAAQTHGGDSGRDATALAFDVATGQPLWQATIDGPGSGQDTFDGVATSPDGSRVYLSGSAQVGSFFAAKEVLTVAYDAATGTELWRVTHGLTDGVDRARAMTITPDGSRVLVTGSTVIDSLDMLTLAHDADTGQVLWSARYAHAPGGWETGEAIAVSPDGNRVAVIGPSDAQASTGDRFQDFATVVYDVATGQQAWVARYDGPASGKDLPRDVLVSADGRHVFVAGTSDSGPEELGTDGPYQDATTVAYDLDTGELAWQARYNGVLGYWDDAFALALAPDGSRLFVSGSTQGADGTDYLALAYDTAVAAPGP